MVRVLFVCLGNICRSPTAEGVFRDIILKNNSHTDILCESRGTGPWHVGEPPDPRSQECALKNNVDISDLRGRQFSTYDFEVFDYILVMDESNYRDVIKLAKNEDDEKKVKYFLKYSPKSRGLNVPDPYHGGPEGFQNVFRLIQEAAEGLWTHLKSEHKF